MSEPAAVNDAADQRHADARDMLREIAVTLDSWARTKESVWHEVWRDLAAAFARRARTVLAGEAVPQRLQVSPGDFGRVVRFEVETEDGTVVRYHGREAEDHCAAIDDACRIAAARGKTDWPQIVPEVIRSATTETAR
jgi:hypothetical protein